MLKFVPDHTLLSRLNAGGSIKWYLLHFHIEHSRNAATSGVEHSRLGTPAHNKTQISTAVVGISLTASVFTVAGMRFLVCRSWHSSLLVFYVLYFTFFVFFRVTFILNQITKAMSTLVACTRTRPHCYVWDVLLCLWQCGLSFVQESSDGHCRYMAFLRKKPLPSVRTALLRKNACTRGLTPVQKECSSCARRPLLPRHTVKLPAQEEVGSVDSFRNCRSCAITHQLKCITPISHNLQLSVHAHSPVCSHVFEKENEQSGSFECIMIKHKTCK